MAASRLVSLHFFITGAVIPVTLIAADVVGLRNVVGSSLPVGVKVVLGVVLCLALSAVVAFVGSWIRRRTAETK